ncbi:unnamed protein product [Timema podura]|uniref:Uncharacterized protein n=1 Tax=Timema podura TaxID=61482 RepID=A0ABN7PBC8_TIMPD|nr:unnamed protein product [Timema podura]
MITSNPNIYPRSTGVSWGQCRISGIRGRRTLSPNVTGSWNKRTSAAMKRKDLGNLWTRVNCSGWKDPS